MYIYVLKDVVSNTTYPIFEANTDQEAIRTVSRVVPEDVINDAELYRLGSYDLYKVTSHKLHNVFSLEDEAVLIEHRKE